MGDRRNLLSYRIIDPCSNGSAFQILMKVNSAQSTIKRFNPCSNGSFLNKFVLSHEVSHIYVLILVLVEVSLKYF